MSSDKVKYDFTKLNKFVKSLSEKKVVQVGIFGKKNTRRDKEEQKILTNSEIGAIHEFGSFSRGIPARSFLRMPISTKGKEILKQIPDVSEQLSEGTGVVVILKQLGISCMGIVQMAFASRGFGQWPPNTPATISRKGSSQPLIDTGQLRRSITSRVSKPA